MTAPHVIEKFHLLHVVFLLLVIRAEPSLSNTLTIFLTVLVATFEIMAAVGKRIRLLLEKQPLIAHGHVIDSAAKMVEAAASVYESPLGPLEVVASEKGIVSVKFLFGKHGCDGSPGERNPEKIGGVEASRHLEECKIWLDAYFSGNLLEMDDPPSKPALVLPEKSNAEVLAQS